MLKKINKNLYYLNTPKCLLGESPIWIDQKKILVWIDILKKKIYFYNFIKKKLSTISITEKPGFISNYKVSTIIVGLESGLYKLNYLKRKFYLIVKFKKNKFRLNDGFVDKQKRIWFNFYDEKKLLPGSLNFYFNKKIVKVVDNLITPNGPIINYRYRKIFFSDTRKKIIYSKDINLKNKKNNIFFSYSLKKKGAPDGMKLIKGKIWAAFFRGSSIKRINMLGKIEKTIKLPVSLVSNLVFCSNSEKEMFITTAYKGMDKKSLKREPLAGRLFYYKF